MTGVQLIAVEGDDTDIRLDRWFRRIYPHVTQGTLQKLLRSGQIRVDGRRVESSTRLSAGQTVRVPPMPDYVAEAAARPAVNDRDAAELRSRILFQDDWVIVIDKPAGLAVQGGSGQVKHLDSMLDALSFGGERPKLVHRLDRDTSGVLLLARTTLAARRLGDVFRGKSARKYYWALTVGVPEEKRGRIDAALVKQGGPSGERVVFDKDEGKPAVSLYSVVDHVGSNAAWVALWPLTGRTHQLRVHMKAIGTPILGDFKYGGAEAGLPGDDLGKSMHLHARRLILPHPSGKGKIDVSAPLPPHMLATWRYFGFQQRDDGDPFAEIAS